jgi:broad specificity phosphatase PhoE
MASPAVIYLLRHGETEWNIARRVQGAGDTPLTPHGVEQAKAMAALLLRELPRPADFAIVSSPQRRAYRTAGYVGVALGLAVATDPRLAEVSLGCWDGMTMTEIDAEYPGALDGSTRGDWYYRSPDGESFDRCTARVGAWLASVKRPTIAVSHGLTGQVLRGVYAGLAREETLALPKPQDGVYRLSGGAVTFIPVTRT